MCLRGRDEAGGIICGNFCMSRQYDSSHRSGSIVYKDCGVESAGRDNDGEQRRTVYGTGNLHIPTGVSVLCWDDACGM